MTAKEKYEIHGLGPYFIFDIETQRMVSMISFRTLPEAEAFIEMLDRGRSERDEENT